MSAVVEVRDVFVAYEGAAESVMALRGADLTVTVGERLLVLGPNGSGKSTLLRVITGEQPVVAGSVVVADTRLHELTALQRRDWRARSVGFVDQHAGRGLLPELSVLDNVALQLRLIGRGGGAAAGQARLACARLGLEPLLDRSVAQLSGGEAQRVAVCAAVAHGPGLVLADEPTAELDEDSAASVYELLARIAADGAGVILVSHDPRAVAAADRVVRIRDGRAAEQWRPDSGVIEQLPDSRGWVRVPREWLPELDPVPPLTASAYGAGVALLPSAARRPASRTPPPGRPVIAPGPGPLALCENLRIAYGERILVDHVDFELSPGSWTAVTGPSGSGKSSLLGVLTGQRRAERGRVQVGERDWTRLNRTERADHRRKWTAILPQQASLLDVLTVRENLLLATDPSAVRNTDQLVELTDRLDLTKLLDQSAGRLSGGERQRVGLVRAALSAAPLLILDEPTSQQDETSVDLVLALLRDEIAAGRTILVASHDERLVTQAGHVLQLEGIGGGWTLKTNN